MASAALLLLIFGEGLPDIKTVSFKAAKTRSKPIPDYQIKRAKRAINSVFKKFEPSWPGVPFVIHHYDFGDGITFIRVADSYGPAAAKRAFDSILNGYAK